jgi:hypothetical protein
LIILIDIFRCNSPIDVLLVPNLYRLKICWSGCTDGLELPTQLFTPDVFFQLTHFSLIAKSLSNLVVQELLSMLSSQCCYSFDLHEYRRTTPMDLEQSTVSNIMVNTFRTLKSWKPMEILFDTCRNGYYLWAYTLPRKCRELSLRKYWDVSSRLA